MSVRMDESGKLITWGSTDDAGQSYVASGKHEETPKPFPLPTEASIVKAAAGWAHCVTVTSTIDLLALFQHTDIGEVYTWGWKECVPSGKVINDQLAIGNMEKESLGRQSALLSEPVSPKAQLSRSTSGAPSNLDNKGGEESTKRRRLSSSKQVPESSTSSDETLSALPCLVTLSPGVRIATVAAGGRHTLALSALVDTQWTIVIASFLDRATTLIHSIFPKVSDLGQVWGWGYGGEGQLGLGSRIRMVSSPHPVPCIEISAYGKDRSFATPGIGMSLEGPPYRTPGNYIKAIACGGRHSAVITDAGAVLTFGWGLYGQCGQGSTDDELSPACVSSLWGIPMKGVAAGLWHTLCVSMDGDVYAFGGNQFGQLGTGADQAEALLMAGIKELMVVYVVFPGMNLKNSSDPEGIR
ncbi:hypothetical protein ACLOJK_030104 [Asimina triloba]